MKDDKKSRANESPVIYIDTCIARDLMKSRNRDSIHLLEVIREKKLRCITSVFLIMELLDIEKDDRFFIKKMGLNYEIDKINRLKYDKDLNREDFDNIFKYFSNFFSETYKFIKIVNLSEEGWNWAFRISHYSNLSAPDSVHLATALDKCNILVTNDDSFIKNAKIFLKQENLKSKKFEICKPSDVIKILSKMNFKI